MGTGYHGGFGSTNGSKKQGSIGTQPQRLRVVKLVLDYLQGPIWKSDGTTGKTMTGIDIVDNDIELQDLNFKCCQAYSGCYVVDSNSRKIDKEKLRNNRSHILYLLEAIKRRLEIINDGSYMVKDLVSEKIKNM